MKRKKKSSRYAIGPLREAVWNRYVGDRLETLCFAGCGRTIRHGACDLGHNISFANGGKTTVENLRPICRACNASLGSLDMEDFMRKHGLSAPFTPGRKRACRGTLSRLSVAEILSVASPVEARFIQSAAERCLRINGEDSSRLNGESPTRRRLFPTGEETT